MEKMRKLHRCFYASAHLVCVVCLSCCLAHGQVENQAKDQLPDAPTPNTAKAKSFFGRWGDFYRQDWKGSDDSSSPEPKRRGLPSPLESPPFPDEDWAYSGAPLIGTPDSNSYPLMTAINNAASRTKIYGWVDTALNFSTSSKDNWPEVNDAYPDRFELSQAVVNVERLPDTVQTDHVDWGYHFTALYGTDYRFTMAKGYSTSQWVDHRHQYGFDPALAYFDVYFPHWFQGANLRFGRYGTLPGIESEQLPDNNIYSFSTVYLVSPTTDTGVMGTVKLNDQWVVQLGVAGSHDVALWTPDAKPSATACVSYTTKSVNDNFYACANGINDGKYAYNNTQQYDSLWNHKFSKSVYMSTESVFLYERDVPAAAGAIVPEPGTFPASCAPGQQQCTASLYGLVNFVQKSLSEHSYLSLRSDYLDDRRGMETGYATKYTENTLTFCHWLGSTVQIRPEIRFEHAWDRGAYDNGQKQNQFTVASDVVFHF